MSTTFFLLAILSTFWGVVTFIRIAAALRERGIPVNMFLARLFFFRYLNQYKDITLRETGTVGPLYRTYIGAMITALLCAIIGLALRAT